MLHGVSFLGIPPEDAAEDNLGLTLANARKMKDTYAIKKTNPCTIINFLQTRTTPGVEHSSTLLQYAFCSMLSSG